MAWQTPKTDWVAADGVRDTDLNRIEANALELYNETARESRIVYVSKSGDDETGTGSSSRPYYTIMKAINSIPKKLNGLGITIYISDGIYDESVVVNGFSGGTLGFTGNAADVTINSLTVEDSSVYCSSLNLILTAAVGLIVVRGTFTTTGDLVVNSSSTAVNVNSGGMVHISGTLTSRATTAVSCSGNSNMYAGTISGVGTLSATMGGVIAFNTSTLNRVTASGGRINTGSQGSGGLTPSALEE